MAVLTQAAFLTKWSGLFADNTTGDISPEDMRDFRQDIADSFAGVFDAAVFTTTVGITGTQISIMNVGRGVTLVEAKGSQTVIVPVRFYLFLDYTSGLAFATNVTIQAQINGVAVSVNNTSLLPSTTDRSVMMATIDIDTTTNISNQPLTLKILTGAPTGGSASTTLFVTTAYYIGYDANF